MTKHRLLRQMSDFGPILDKEVAFSRLSTPNHENHLHHDQPMDPTKGLNRSIWGVEAISHKITAENHILRQMSDFGPILDEEVAFSCTSTSNHENHLHHDPPTDPKKGLNRSICGVEAISHKIWAREVGWGIHFGFQRRLGSRRLNACIPGWSQSQCPLRGVSSHSASRKAFLLLLLLATLGFISTQRSNAPANARAATIDQ